jgi:hypothetical protein
MALRCVPRTLLLGILGILGLALSLAIPVPALAARYSPGEKVQVTGLVTDGAGKPLADVRVVLEASRGFFNLRQLRPDQRETRRVQATTNSQGAYSLEWPWDGFFNRFELLVGIPIRRAGGEQLEVLEREDVTRRIEQGSPVVSAVVVRNAELIRKVQEFLASLKSDDERRIYQEMGRPDEVKKTLYPDRQEISWWYFDRGRMYRFRDGRLEQVVPFDAVQPF